MPPYNNPFIVLKNGLITVDKWMFKFYNILKEHTFIIYILEVLIMTELEKKKLELLIEILKNLNWLAHHTEKHKS